MLYHQFVVNNVKCIPDDIFNMLDPVGLAHWIICDGHYKSNSILLCTDSFTLTDVVKLMNVLRIRWGVDPTIHMYANKPRIYIKSKDIKVIIDSVTPHMYKSWLRCIKWDVSYTLQWTTLIMKRSNIHIGYLKIRWITWTMWL